MTDEKNSEIKTAISKEKSLNLKTIREARGLTLKEVFQRTRVGIAHLEAIESEDFRQLPEPVYARNFIKMYAQVLGVDHREILERYEQYLKSLEAPRQGAVIGKEHGRFKRSNKYILVISSTIVIIAIFIIMLLSLRCDKNNSDVSPKVSAGDLSPRKGIEANQKVQADVGHRENQKRPVSTNMASYKLVITARDDTWLRITKDQETPREFLLRRGDKIEEEASFFILDIGNAGGVNLEFQGKSMGNLGDLGQVIHLKLPEI
jgi:cytoskeletal protein RodZ